MRRRLCVATLAALGSALAVAAPAPAAVTIGSSFSAASNANGVSCGFSDCTVMTLSATAAQQAPGGLRSPIDGVITSWAFRSGSMNTVSLRVLRPAGGSSFTGAGTSAPVTLPGGLNGPISSQLPIKQGDAIGLNGSSGALILGDSAGATLGYWNSPTLADNETRPALQENNLEAQVRADVEPDVDCDGKGDETQDGNLNDSSCSKSSGNPNAPQQTLSAKKKQKLNRAAITDTLDKDGTVTVKATVSIFGQTVVSKKTKGSLTANTPTKLRIKFSRAVKKVIREAIAKKGPRRAKVTAIAANAQGQTSTAKISFKLTG